MGARIAGVRRLFRLPARAGSVGEDVDAELEFHLAMRASELERRGQAPEAARAQAEREFGDLEAARHELTAMGRGRVRRERRTEWWDALGQDVVSAVRRLRHTPGFAMVVVLTVAVGIGANAAMYGVIDRLLLRPPAHIAQPESVRLIYFTQTFSWAGLVTQRSASYPDYAAFRELPAFSGVAAYYADGSSLGAGAGATPIRRVSASGTYFRVLGVRPELGRFFDDGSDRSTGERVAVLSHGFWRRELGEDPGVLGRRLTIGARSYTVVGVAPAGFTGAELGPVDVWVPLSASPPEFLGEVWREEGGWRWIRLVARLAPGVSAEEAASEATASYRHTQEAETRDDPTARVELGSIIAARDEVGRRAAAPMLGRAGDQARISLWLGGVALLVLVIACANVANLLLARAMRRRREIGVRVALGVGRGRLFSALLTESLLLALLGGAAGLLLARVGGRLLATLLLTDVAPEALGTPAAIILVGIALAALAGVATGVAPALFALRSDVITSLKAGAREGGGRGSRVRTALVLVQSAVSVLLLVGAGLFVRSLLEVRRLDLGFDADRVAVVRLALPGRAQTEVDRLYAVALERVSRLPTVERAAIGTTVPFESAISTDLRVPGVDSIPITGDGGPYVNAVTPGFFATMGTHIVRGRPLTRADVEGSPRAVVVSTTFARRVWPGLDPLGRCMIIGSDDAPCSSVVGVAEDAHRQSLDDVPVMQYYVPLEQHQVTPGLRALFVRTRGDPAAALPAIRRQIQTLEADLPYPSIDYLATLIDPQVRPFRLGATLFGLFGALALVLAALGLYSVIAYTVTQRRHELGVRMALGARRADVARLVVLQTLRLLLLGLGIGLLIAVMSTGRLTPLLFNVSTRDPLVFGGVTATLLLAGIAASVLPARRAMRVEPMRVLREE